MRRPGVSASTLALLCALTLPACGGGPVSPGYTAPPARTPPTDAAPWPLPADPLSLVREAGLTPDTHEFFTFHVHAHIDVFLNGRPVRVPGGIGIDITNAAVHRGETDGAPAYGGIRLCPRPCISPLHTHDVTGVVHMEAPMQTSFTLGQFFREWGVRLDASCVGGYCRPATSVVVFVDGKRRAGNPAVIPLTAHEEIAVIIGTPPKEIPSA